MEFIYIKLGRCHSGSDSASPPAPIAQNSKSKTKVGFKTKKHYILAPTCFQHRKLEQLERKPQKPSSELRGLAMPFTESQNAIFYDVNRQVQLLVITNVLPLDWVEQSNRLLRSFLTWCGVCGYLRIIISALSSNARGGRNGARMNIPTCHMLTFEWLPGSAVFHKWVYTPWFFFSFKLDCPGWKTSLSSLCHPALI